MAHELGVELNKNDIQRVHRLGKKRPTGKPRQIIVRFASYKKRNEFIRKKSVLKSKANLKHQFITEDLTQLRSKLLIYLKETCKDEYVMIHTINGRIRMKKSMRASGEYLGPDEKDFGTGKWIYISSPDDLFRNGIELDFKKLNYKPLGFNYNNDNGNSSNVNFM